MIVPIKTQIVFRGRNPFYEMESTVNSKQIKGQVKKLGVNMTFPCQVFLMDRQSMQLIQTTLSDSNGYYSFDGLTESFKFAVIAIDPKRMYNAVIQDNVEPK
jgi:hypothetical protein